MQRNIEGELRNSLFCGTEARVRVQPDWASNVNQMATRKARSADEASWIGTRAVCNRTMYHMAFRNRDKQLSVIKPVEFTESPDVWCETVTKLLEEARGAIHKWSNMLSHTVT